MSVINRPTWSLMDSPKPAEPVPDRPDTRPSAPERPDVPDRSKPVDPTARPAPVPGSPPRVTRWELLAAIARLEDQAVRQQHFTVLDSLLRLKTRFAAI
jgi:hypothetical protein